MNPYDSANLNLTNPWATASTISLVVLVVALLVLWSIIWKGLALWRAARNGDKGWYVVLLLLNTAGLLEILYYFIFGKKAKPVAAASTTPVAPAK